MHQFGKPVKHQDGKLFKHQDEKSFKFLDGKPKFQGLRVAMENHIRPNHQSGKHEDVYEF